MKPLFLFLSFFFVVGLSAQNQYPRDAFRSPMDIPMYLAGTFGEPRNTHFHAGLDIKTQGVEGKNIYAIGDGYISRIKVSAWGYGNTLYITHTNGYTSVYAHLKEFNASITKYVEQQQMDQTKFEVDLDSLGRKLFVLQKGDKIALSGNTGGSQGPHLHFEIRDSLERPINPFLFGFDIKVKDNVRPGLYNLAVFNLTSQKQFSNTKTIRLTDNKTGTYTLSETIKVNKDAIGFGINTTDKFTDVHNHNGVYDIKMFFDGEEQYHYQMNRFSFENGRDVLTHCDYWLKRDKNLTVHKCFVEPGNNLSTYNYLINNGYIYLYDNLVHNVKIEVSDFHKNKSTLNFKVQRDDNSGFFKEKEYNFQEVLVQGRSNFYKNDDFEISLPENALFENVFFSVKQETKTIHSDKFDVGDVKIPASEYFNVKLKIKEFNPHFQDKYLVAFKDYKGRVKSLGGELNPQTNTLSAESRGFGEYYVAIDTVPPRIVTLSVTEGKIMSKYTKFQFKITDNLAGIEEYNLFINGNWVVLALDGKKALYTYTVDDNIVKGANSILLIAKDNRNNASTFSADFVY